MNKHRPSFQAVTATVNGEKTVFQVAASDAPGASGSMGAMKMH
jgi:hypothetical protein